MTPLPALPHFLEVKGSTFFNSHNCVFFLTLTATPQGLASPEKNYNNQAFCDLPVTIDGHSRLLKGFLSAVFISVSLLNPRKIVHKMSQLMVLTWGCIAVCSFCKKIFS